MSVPYFCSGCGKKIIGGACLVCCEKMLADLERRRNLKPGCPKIAGEYRMSGHEYGDAVPAKEANDDDGAFENVVKAYEEDR